MKKYTLILMSLITVMLFSCKKNDGDPKAVLSQFFDAMAKKDITKAKSLATEESKSLLDLMEVGLKMDTSSNEINKYDQSRMEFGEPVIVDDKATISVKEKNSGESLSFSLKKVKGSWKVAFDKASMINMGMEKMKESGGNASENIEKAMKGINEKELDSLKKGFRNSMKTLDSVSKELNK